MKQREMNKLWREIEMRMIVIRDEAVLGLRLDPLEIRVRPLIPLFFSSFLCMLAGESNQIDIYILKIKTTLSTCYSYIERIYPYRGLNWRLVGSGAQTT